MRGNDSCFPFLVDSVGNGETLGNAFGSNGANKSGARGATACNSCRVADKDLLGHKAKCAS